METESNDGNQSDSSLSSWASIDKNTNKNKQQKPWHKETSGGDRLSLGIAIQKSETDDNESVHSNHSSISGNSSIASHLAPIPLPSSMKELIQKRLEGLSIAAIIRGELDTDDTDTIQQSEYETSILSAAIADKKSRSKDQLLQIVNDQLDKINSRKRKNKG